VAALIAGGWNPEKKVMRQNRNLYANAVRIAELGRDSTLQMGLAAAVDRRKEREEEMRTAQELERPI
jgi:hypothetical protein